MNGFSLHIEPPLVSHSVKLRHSLNVRVSLYSMKLPLSFHPATQSIQSTPLPIMHMIRASGSIWNQTTIMSLEFEQDDISRKIVPFSVDCKSATSSEHPCYLVWLS